MTARKNPTRTALALVAGCALTLGVSLASSNAQTNMQQTNPNATPAGHAAATTGSASAKPNNGAQQLVDDAVNVVGKMKSDPKLVDLMKKAKGLYIVPEFGRGALIVGGRGGPGLLVARENNGWSGPAFYDFGAISLGAQAGGSGGSVVFLLMDQKAVDAFKNANNFSLNTGAGLSIVTYSASTQASWGKGDIIMWTNTSGAYAGATVSVSDVSWDQGNNRAYYGKDVKIGNILSGSARNAKADKLKQVLPS